MELSTLSLLLCICEKGHKCIHMCENSFICYTEHVWRSEDNLRESVFCIFLPCGPKNWMGLSGLMTSTFTHWAILLGPQINFNNSSRNNRDANIQMLITQKQCAEFSYRQPNPNNLSLFRLLKTGLAGYMAGLELRPSCLGLLSARNTGCPTNHVQHTAPLQSDITILLLLEEIKW